MQKIEIEFFEEYKKVNNICSDIYGNRGISQYIDEMAKHAGTGERYVIGWDKRYKTLKHLRWLRNQIAHESDSYYEVTVNDINDIKKFHDQILTQTDPLAQLHQAMERKAAANASARKPAVSTGTYTNTPQNEPETNWVAIVVVSVIVFILILVFAVFMSKISMMI